MWLMFFIIILISIFYEEPTRIERTSGRIHFSGDDRPTFQLERHWIYLLFFACTITTLIFIGMDSLYSSFALFCACIFLHLMDPMLLDISIFLPLFKNSYVQRVQKLFTSKSAEYGHKLEDKTFVRAICILIHTFVLTFVPTMFLTQQVRLLFFVVAFVAYFFFQIRLALKQSKLKPKSSSRLSKRTILSKKSDFIPSSINAKSSYVSPCGTVRIVLIRGDLKFKGESEFGRKVNPYVVVTYTYTKGNNVIVESQHSKTILRGGSTPLWNDVICVHLAVNAFNLLFEVYDQDDIDYLDPKHDRLLCWNRVDIREWLANRRFEGSIEMYDDGGKCAESIQLDVKVNYPKAGANVGERPQLSATSVVSFFFVCFYYFYF